MLRVKIMVKKLNLISQSILVLKIIYVFQSWLVKNQSRKFITIFFRLNSFLDNFRLYIFSS